MMRFFLWVVIVLVGIFSFPVTGQTIEQEDVSAERAVLMDQETGDVLFEKDAYTKTEIASITKVMTALVALQYGNLEDEVKISRKAAFTTGSSIYLEINEKMTLEDLLYGLMLRSGNDAAVAIAEHVGGSEAGFVYLMNETAEYIGMTDTHFMNAHGLDKETHYSTAYDMALLTQHAMDNEIFRKISGTKSYQAETRAYAWQNKNKLLTSLYEASTGGKTGYTKIAGRTLISTAEKSEQDLIAVTLNAPDDWNDHILLFERAFAEKEEEAAYEEEHEPVFKQVDSLSTDTTGQGIFDIVRWILRMDVHG